MGNYLYEKGVVLGYAYQKLGRLSYPGEWAGVEIAALRRNLPNDPAVLPWKKAELEKRKKALQQRMDIQRAEWSKVDGELRQQISALKDVFARHLAQLDGDIEALSNIPQREQEFRFVSRAHEIRDRIIDVLDTGTLGAFCCDDSSIQSSFWKDRSFGWVDWENSLAYFFQQKGYARRKLVLLDRAQVDGWIDSHFEPDDPEDWTVWRMKELAKGLPPKSKKILLSDFSQVKPEITKAMFDRAWKTHAPSDWKRKGRRKG